MNLPALSCDINSPSNKLLKHSSFCVFAPVNIISIFVFIRYILPLSVINIRWRSPSAFSVTTKSFLILGRFEFSSIVAIFVRCNVFEFGPMKFLFSILLLVSKLSFHIILMYDSITSLCSGYETG